MADMLQMAGLAITGGVLLILLRENTPTIGFCLSAVLVVSIFLRLGPKLMLAMDGTSSLFGENHALFVLLLRGIGISYITQITATLLSGAGEESAAKAITMAGNAMLAVLALEPASDIIRAAEALLS